MISSIINPITKWLLGWNYKTVFASIFGFLFLLPLLRSRCKMKRFVGRKTINFIGLMASFEWILRAKSKIVKSGKKCEKWCTLTIAIKHSCKSSQVMAIHLQFPPEKNIIKIATLPTSLSCWFIIALWIDFNADACHHVPQQSFTWRYSFSLSLSLFTFIKFHPPFNLFFLSFQIEEILYFDKLCVGVGNNRREVTSSLWHWKVESIRNTTWQK